MNSDLLKQKAEILDDFFGIHIDEHGNISRLPVILDQYTPDMDRIPEFVLSLGNDVSYKFLHSSSFKFMEKSLLYHFLCVHISDSLVILLAISVLPGFSYALKWLILS